MNGQEILLESGTNEFEIVEFFVGSQSYGVNVAKVREIIQYDGKSITPIPEHHPAMLGLYYLRNETFPLIDLASILKNEHVSNSDRRVILVCEFNTLVNGFLVDGVRQIHRCSWESVKPVANFVSQYRPMITSTVHFEDRQILILDLEHIISTIYPQSAVTYDEDNLPASSLRREEAQIIVAEDSPLIRDAVIKILKKVGYTNLTVFTNGKDAFAKVMEIKEEAESQRVPIKKFISGILTDIEMPQMDGLTLCRKVKMDAGIDLPVIMFSSMINEQMAMKCREVGANAYTTKPQTSQLIELIDQYFLNK
ncbi:MAG: chemotaxis protein CheV [Nitrospinae bacterium]|nr:chemotaxis protein CheV [Nitrospinota bacterium]